MPVRRRPPRLRGIRVPAARRRRARAAHARIGPADGEVMEDVAAAVARDVPYAERGRRSRPPRPGSRGTADDGGQLGPGDARPGAHGRRGAYGRLSARRGAEVVRAERPVSMPSRPRASRSFVVQWPRGMFHGVVLAVFYGSRTRCRALARCCSSTASCLLAGAGPLASSTRRASNAAFSGSRKCLNCARALAPVQCPRPRSVSRARSCGTLTCVTGFSRMCAWSPTRDPTYGRAHPPGIHNSEEEGILELCWACHAQGRRGCAWCQGAGFERIADSASSCNRSSPCGCPTVSGRGPAVCCLQARGSRLLLCVSPDRHGDRRGRAPAAQERSFARCSP